MLAMAGGCESTLIALGLKEKPPELAVSPERASQDAKSAMLSAADAESPAVRSHAIEALSATLGDDATAVYLQGLRDDSPMVQFAATMAVGKLQLSPAEPRLLEMAKAEGPDKRVYAGVIYALHKLGNDDYTGDLYRLLFHREPAVRANAALAMGLMGEPSAIDPLSRLLANEENPAVRLGALEALAMLGDEKSQELLEAYTKWKFVDLRLVAIPALARTETARAVYTMRELTHERNPPRVRVMAAGMLAKLGEPDEEMYEYCLLAAQSPQTVMNEAFEDKPREVRPVDVESLQRLAAMAVGQWDNVFAINTLHPLQRNRSGGVRVAAAMSTYRLAESRMAMAGPAAAQPAPVTGPTTQPAAKPAAGPGSTPKMKTAGGRD
jgi:HEAT repeat protein